MADSRVIAFAGNGDTSLENVTAVLNNWLPEDVEVTGFYVPDAIAARKQKGLANVVSYLTENFADDSGDDPFETVSLTELVNELRTVSGVGGPEQFLIVILGEAEPDDTTAELIEAAREVNIPVLDLAAGLDEYTADEQRNAVEELAKEAPEPEPERPARRRRTASTSEPAEAVSEPEKPRRQIGTPRTKREVEEIGTKALDDLAAKRKAAEDERAAAEDTPPFDGPYSTEEKRKAAGVREHPEDPRYVVPDIPTGDVASAHIKELLRQVIREELAAMLYGALHGISGGQALLAAGGPQPRAEASPETVDAPTAAYIKDSDGALRRRGRGKPRAGEEVVWLTAAQAAAQGFQEDK